MVTLRDADLHLRMAYFELVLVLDQIFKLFEKDTNIYLITGVQTQG